jgi:hypothetical protein
MVDPEGFTIRDLTELNHNERRKATIMTMPRGEREELRAGGE